VKGPARASTTSSSDLPDVLAELAVAWRLELRTELSTAQFHRVVEARTRDGADVVVKLASAPARAEDTVLALRAWNGRGAPEVLEFDPIRGAMLLERIWPGTKAVDATPAEAACLIESLGVEPPAGLPALDDVVRGRIDAAEREARASRPRVAWARKALERLGETRPGPVLVHGSFDERNVLRCARRTLCAIDPSPCAGDSGYDAACWIHANGRAGRRVRFDALTSELELDRARLRDWCGVIAVHG
jgi:streptomycin 6-kinase